MRRNLFLLLLILILLVPAGLITENPAWGEWDAEFFKETIGYIPKGIENAISVVRPQIPHYSLPGTNPVLSYYISAITGSLLLISFFYLVYFITKRKKA